MSISLATRKGSVENVVIVELAIRGTHKGELHLPSGTLAPTGKVIDVPSCDVFHLENGKIISFHCYNEASVMQQQLGLGGASELERAAS